MCFNRKRSTGVHLVTGLQFLVIIIVSLWAPLMGHVGDLSLTQRATTREPGNSWVISITSPRGSLILDYSLFYTFQKRMQADGCLPHSLVCSYSYLLFFSFFFLFFSFIFVLRQDLTCPRLGLSSLWHWKYPWTSDPPALPLTAGITEACYHVCRVYDLMGIEPGFLAW